MTALAAVSAANRPNSSRQPIQSSNRSAGNVAVTAPSAPSITIQPFRSGTRSPGNQSTSAFKPAVMAEATPSPINARPTSSIQKSSDTANNVEPTAATT